MQNLDGKKVLVVGCGISGSEVARYLAQKNCEVTLTDSLPETKLQEQFLKCADLPIVWELGGYKLESFIKSDLIVVSPGVSLSLPELVAARGHGVPVTNEAELAFREIEEPVIAVTGSCGRGATSTLIAEMIRADGKICFSGGGTGVPLISYVMGKRKAQFVVAELSCVQLELIESLTPTVAVFTNITEGYSEQYNDMETYVDAQRKLLDLCSSTTRVVLNLENPWLARFSESTSSPVLWFSKRDVAQVAGALVEELEGAFYQPETDEIIHVRKDLPPETYSLKGLNLPAEFQRENIMAALCAVRAVGVAASSIHRTKATVGGVSLELVHETSGIPSFDDSSDGNPRITA